MFRIKTEIFAFLDVLEERDEIKYGATTELLLHFDISKKDAKHIFGCWMKTHHSDKSAEERVAQCLE